MSKPFENMAISLSGGGYRAATFHLGALSYLDHVVHEDRSLLQRIKVISTISGGTFTGVNYVLALAQDKDFKSCFQRLYRLFEEDKLVVEALEMVNDTRQWKAQEKSKNLINAFSEVYQAKYCDNQHLSLLLESPLGHLDEFCFNATDLYDSLPYRFQKTGKIGNGKINIDAAAAAEIRLGDVMAASSCFPGGFEPMAFPKDFLRDKNSPLAVYWREMGYPENIALMDGGILDNQGIESVELANNRRPEGDKLDTYIISDVSSRNAQPFEFQPATKSGLLGRLTLRSLGLLLAVIAVLSVAGAWWYWNASRVLLILSVLTATFSTLFLLAVFGIQWFIDKLITGTVGQTNETPAILSNLDILEKTPLHVLRRLVATRLFSLGDIMENTFMSRIRTLQFNFIYNDEVWKHKLISNNIYSLYTNYKDAPYIPSPSPQMLDTAKKAAAMPTSLWFSTEEKKAHMLDALIIAGQINLCFQLLKYLEEEKASFPAETLSSLGVLKEKILADYNNFIVDEKWLLARLTVV